MNHVSTLGQVAEQVDQLNRNGFDTMIPVKDITFQSLEKIRIGNDYHPLRPVAQRSIAWRLGIPLQYLYRCPEEIQAFQMNFWIQKERNEELFFRFDGDEVRAIFTKKYKPTDNWEIMRRLDGLGCEDSTPVHYHLDQEFMSLSVLNNDGT